MVQGTLQEVVGGSIDIERTKLFTEKFFSWQEFPHIATVYTCTIVNVLLFY